MLMRKRLWIPIVVLLAAAGVGYGIYSTLTPKGQGHIPVSVVEAQPQAFAGQTIRVAGIVAPGTIRWDPRARTTSFTLTDGKGNLSAVYPGLAPDSFGPGARIAVEGKLGPDNTFIVSTFNKSLCNVCHSN